LSANDDWGDAATAVTACEAPESYGATEGDTDDADPAVNRTPPRSIDRLGLP